MMIPSVSRSFRPLALLSVAILLAGTGTCLAQLGGPPGGDRVGTGIATQPVRNAEKPIKILQPTLDQQNATITLPAAFWNQHMTSWVEVALCGRPSDFLHETIACVTTTKTTMMQAMRAVGFRDADHWVANVHDFPRIRGDRALVLLEVTRDGKKETYALDELLVFQGWGAPAGPYGWMFKGDPERDQDKPAAPDAAAARESDSTKIIRDDPQIALQFKGIQHISRSFMDHPLCYDDWIYPMMRYGRNYRLLPAAVYDSNGDVPVTLSIRKVNEEQFLTEIARVWHDEKCREYILQQVPTAKQIDKDKSALEALVPEVRKMAEVPAEKRDPAKEEEVFGQAAVLAASIEKGYAALDAAWADWAADHPVFEAENDKDLETLKQQAKQWREHMDLNRDRAADSYLAEDAANQQKQLARQVQTDAIKARLSQLRGTEIEANSAALRAGNKHPLEYWKWELGRLNVKEDPRTDWIRHVTIQNELVQAREETGNAGVEYGRALREGAADLRQLQDRYQAGLRRVALAKLRLDLANIDFEIEKRVGLGDDPDLPELQKQKKKMEEDLKTAEAATQPSK